MKLGKSNKSLKTVLGLSLCVLMIAGIFFAVHFYELAPPEVSLDTEVTLLGAQGEIGLTVRDPGTGIQEVTVVLRQDKKEVTLWHRQMYKNGLLGSGPKELRQTIAYHVKELGMKDGRADLVITARDFSFWRWMRGNESKALYPVVFDATPPRLRLLDTPLAMRPGSAGVVVFRANEDLFDDGVMVDGFFHRAFPLPDRGDGVYGAIIALPYDTTKVTSAFISARDKAGNEGRKVFGLDVRRVRKKTDRINISDGFLDRKIPEFSEFYPEMKGDKIEKYIYVNNVVRKQNADKIREICRDSVPEQLWKGRFGRMRRSSRRAGFAEYRTYYYHGKKIDHQVHLGIDLASVRRAPVEAANAGRVVYADYLGIYGNMVMIDHGLGVFTLYSHMSEIGVAVGDTVNKGDVLGRTGATGMAGGDHLHFSVLVNGIFVNPVEWWDKNWVRVHITDPLR